LLINLIGHGFDIANDSEQTHQSNEIVGDVDFPPVESLSGRGLVLMVIIVPPLAEGNESYE
jgi:hypothetical protein